MRVFYGQAKGNAHRYQCRGDDAHVGAGLCIGIGGVRVDRAMALQILEAVSDRAVEAAILASDQVERLRREIIAVEREPEVARYEASLAARRYELVDPAKRHVARAAPGGQLAHGGDPVRVRQTKLHFLIAPLALGASASACLRSVRSSTNEMLSS